MKWHIICQIGEENLIPASIEDEEFVLPLHFSGGTADTQVRESAVDTIESAMRQHLAGVLRIFFMRV